MTTTDVFKFIEENEGRRDRVYKDTVGHLTIGVGFNLDRAGARNAIEQLGVNFEDVRAGRVTLTNDQINQLLATDITKTRLDVKKVFPEFDSYSPQRQAALTDMMFNLGSTRFRGFRNMIAAIKEGDWEKAAEQAEDSRWFSQVARRGPLITNMLRNG